MIAVGDDRNTAIGLYAGYPPGVVFTGYQASLAVAGQTVGAVGGFVEQRTPTPGSTSCGDYCRCH
jgi:hypothetical protein